jgi:hypothetical protein
MVIDKAREFYEVSQTAPLIPAIVNAALSIELYLKSLTARDSYHNPHTSLATIGDKAVSVTGGVITSKSLHEHNLARLLGKLTSLPRDRLEASLEKQFSLSLADLRKMLEPFSNTFVAYRYIYEKANPDIDWEELKKVRDIVRDSIEGMSNYYSLNGKYFP